jgi:aminoglycoside 3-N-acetyltransferase
VGYTADDLVTLFERLGVEPGTVVYVISALWRVPGYDGEPETLARTYYEALRRVVGDEGTIVVPTHSQNLCNTDIPFDLDRTPSHERGIFSEYIRLLPEAKRSFHPFNSYAAVGPRADEITADVSRHAYGPFTPEARMIDLQARTVTIGLPPNITTTVHHVEQTMSVPYRYTKEFMHPVVRDGVVEVEPFYLYVWYREADLNRSLNRPLLRALAERMEIREEALGRGKFHSYRTDEFFHHSLRVFKENPYVWCATPPTVRPWQR